MEFQLETFSFTNRDYCRCHASVCRSCKLRAPSKRLDKVETRACEIQGELERHFHFDRAMRFNSSVISRIWASNSRSRRVAASALINVRLGAACGKAFVSGTIQMSMAISKATTRMETHQWKYLLIHCCMNVLL